MPNFMHATDQEIIDHLVDHFSEFGVGEPDAGLGDRLLRELGGSTSAIERDEHGFAIVARANRKHASAAAFIMIPPQADLLFLFVSQMARSKGTGSALLARVQSKYMEDQAMILVCAGDRRKSFFEDAGFMPNGLTHEGYHFMFCPARTFANER